MKKNLLMLLLLLFASTANAAVPTTLYTILASPHFGTLSSETLNVIIQPDTSMIGQPGSLFVAALMPDKLTWYSNTQSAGWQLWDPQTPMPAASLPSVNEIKPILDMDVSQSLGATRMRGMDQLRQRCKATKHTLVLPREV